MTEKTIDEAEARRILENLARNGPPTAQVASIKVLLAMDKDAEAAKEPEPTQFERLGLYDDEFSRRQARKKNETVNRRTAAAAYFSGSTAQYHLSV